MKKLITKFKTKQLQFMFTFLAVMGISAGSSLAQAPWCNSSHTYSYNTGYHYCSINEVQFQSGGVTVFKKAPDGSNAAGTCASEYRLVNLPSKAFDLVAGNTYTLLINSTSTYTGYTANVGLFIDYNANNSFDNGEMVSSNWTTSASGTNPSSLSSFNFTVPCNIKTGASRIRIVTDMSYYPISLGTACAQYCALNGMYGYPYYGETEDFSINLLLPTTLSANFVVPSPIYIKSAIKFINSNQKGYIEHAWDANNDGTYEVKSPNPDYTNPQMMWSSAGNKCLKLRSTNCLGKDSVVKCFNVIAPTQAPVADFVSSATSIEQYNSIQLFDLSTQGPYVWAWECYDSSDVNNVKDENSGALSFSSSTVQNPVIDFNEPGLYTVALTCKNDIGLSGLKRKIGYIKVVEPTQYSLCFGPNKTESATGTVYDNGGPNSNYTTAGSEPGCSRLGITPCNAEKINLVFTKIKFSKADHVVKVYDAPFPDPGKLIKSVTMADKSALPLKLTATSGSMFITFDASSGGVDSGFAAYYTSVLGSATPPTPSFTTATTPGYNRVPLRHSNTTAGVVGVPTYTWTIDDNPVPTSELITMPDGRVDLLHAYYTDGPYNVCLEVKSCAGTASVCNTVNVVTPNTKTQLDFVASNTRPNTGEVVTMQSLSDKADKFIWTVFPYTTASLQSGTGTVIAPGVIAGQYPQFKFTAAGKYTFTLRAWNSNDSVNTVNTKVKDKYVVVLDYCKPASNILSADVAVNRVIVKDNGGNVLLDNSTDGGIAAYTDYTSNALVTVPAMTFGGAYTLQMSRNTAVDPGNRVAWIDFNIDGDFDDANEKILVEASANSLSNTASFTVPFLKDAYEGMSRMRVAINYSSNSTTPCGPIVAGEYEDYAVKLVNDNLTPVLTLNGSDTVEIEKCFPYADLGAIAFDPTEGNISNRIVKTSDLDSCTTGIYTIEYNVTDASGNPAPSVKRTIKVVTDKTKPVLTVAGANPFYIEANRNNGPYQEPGLVTATDNVNGDITSSIVVSGSVDTRALGTYILTYTVQDVAKNQAVATRTVIVRDTKSPTIINNGSEKLQINSLWVDQTMAFDSFDNAPVLTPTPGYNGEVNTLKKASYPISYMAVDQSGNTYGPIVRTYVVDDYVPPTVSFDGAQGKVYVHDVNTPYTSEKPSYSDNYYPNSAVSLVLTNPGVVNPNTLGTYVEIWKAEDASGNVTLAQRTVKVVDRQAPVISADIIHACVESPINPYEGISTTDNYYSPAQLKPLIEVVSSNVNQWQAGIYTITYRVTDPSNNTSMPFTRLVEYTYWPTCANSLSVDDVNIDNAITLYPNPTNGIVTIDLNGNITDKVQVEVYNAMGAKVQTIMTDAGMSKYMLDLSGYASGVYMVKMNVGGHVVTKRVAKN